MDDLKNYAKKFKVGNPNQDHATADIVYQGFSKQIRFPLIMVFIKNHGRQFVYETYNSIRQSKAKNPVALFLWYMKNNHVELKECPKNPNTQSKP